MPSPEEPLHGSCACGAVRFAVTAPFETAGYCHCHRCQQRAGVAASVNAQVARSGFEIVEGGEHVRTWRPEGGNPKSFCELCGGHLFSGDPQSGPMIGVRLGTLEGDPGIRPQWRQWVSAQPDWEAIPDDGLPRFPAKRSA